MIRYLAAESENLKVRTRYYSLMPKTPECEMGRHTKLCSNQDQCECECHDPHRPDANLDEEMRRREGSLEEPKFSNA
jgi:hypothetical protein